MVYNVTNRLEINLPHSAVPYSFQCERVLAVIANVKIIIQIKKSITGCLGMRLSWALLLY